MVSEDQGQPLANEPAREASASLRGYAFQIWRSVLAWIELSERERLYLEGSEDYDRIDELSAETVQIKDVKANLTLRSPDVVEAIDNAWSNQQRNLRHAIRFRFLTTADPAIEKGAPFGVNVSGLKLWRSCRLSADVVERERDARAISTFLLNEGKISAALQSFLRKATDAELWQKLIAPIEWDTGAEETPEVVQEIKDRLVVLGESTGVTPDGAETVAASLYAIAFNTASQETGRFLTRADFLREFQNRTRVSLPAATATALFAAIPKHLVSQASPVRSATGGGEVRRPPPLPPRYYERADILSGFDRRLALHPVLVLQGSTGVGKSIAAAGHAALSTLSWGWVDLRAVHGRELIQMLDRIATELTIEDGLTHVVLDDLELSDDHRPLEAPLARIKSILAARQGNLIITSSVVLPQRLSLVLDMPDESMTSLPAFTQEEIADFLITRGCPEGRASASLATFIELHTSGHAQLVHARVATLEAQNFPMPDANSLMLTPPDIVEARAESRKLIAKLPQPQRELIYRLSLTVHALSRRHVLAIGQQPVPVAEPGFAFDALVGPWVELAAEDRFRLSPLLRGVGTEVQGEEWTSSTHSSIARTILGFRTLSQADVSTVLFHATAGRDWQSIARLSIGILKSDNSIWNALGDSVSWFVHVGTGEAKARIRTDTLSLLLIRLLQYRLSVAGENKEEVLSIVESIDRELPEDVEGKSLRAARYFFLAQVMLHPTAHLPLRRHISLGLEYIRLSDEMREAIPGMNEAISDHSLHGPDGRPDLASLAGFSLIPRLTERAELNQLLDECEPLEAASVRRLLWFIGGSESVSQLVVDRSWVAELNSVKPNWARCRELFERAYRFGIRCDLLGLSQAAARGILRIVDENMGAPEQALRLADEMVDEIGQSLGQLDGRATILQRMGDDTGALAIWRQLLPAWKARDEFDLQPAFSHRQAAVSAANLDEWTEAVSWLRSARSLLSNDSSQAKYRAGLLIDEGYARWTIGDNQGALACLIDGLVAIDELPADDVDEAAYILRKRAGHTLMWISACTAGRPPQNFTAPPPACCSSLNPVKEKTEPSTPSDAMWVHLIEFELQAGLGDAQLRANEARLKASRYGVMRSAFNQLRLQHRLRTLELDDLVEVVRDWVGSVLLYRRYYSGNAGAADALPLGADSDKPEIDAELFLAGMLNALFAVAARQTFTNALLDRWLIAAEGAGLTEIAAPWLEFVTRLFVANDLNAETAMHEMSSSWPWQGAASIRIAIDSATRPAQLLVVHHHWTVMLRKTAGAVFTLSDVEELVIRAWTAVAEEGLFLRAPAVNGPLLLEACRGPETGWPKVGRILAAACDAVPATVPTAFRNQFRDLK